MGGFRENWWRWVRGGAACLLACLLVAFAVQEAGRIIIDTSTTPPTPHVVGRLSGSLPGIGIALFSLACIFFGMWKRWDFEIVGWVLLLTFLLLGMAH